MRRIAVIGAGGLLGQYVVKEAVKGGYEVLGTFHNLPVLLPSSQTEFMDITEPDQTVGVLRSFMPDSVILTAALTNVDLCEGNPSEAWRVNAEGTLNVAQACREIDAKLLYVSTDYVFGGSKGTGYFEFESPDPLNIYAQTKLEGERLTLDSSKGNLVCRVSVLYGWNRVSEKKNFVTWIIDSLRSGRELLLFDDQIASPTYAPHCAQILMKLLESRSKGVYHTSGPDCISRYDIGLKVARSFDLDRSLIRRVATAEMELPARRPRCSCLDVKKTEAEINMKMLSLEEGLEEMRLAEGKG